ncbi:neuralized-like protein 2 [Diachasmimorpha longicaudata]|uniref:neuralized-like protein 2 n=1 Tax=Diachasmimorpha longicaudata TaxID=58733 RepID=UPI0030B8CE7D
MSEKSRKLITRFHPSHGRNIILYDDDTVAYRKASFADALTFSEKPLQPDEIFLLEIEKHERGWNGHMRLGLTQIDPKTVDRNGIPQYALPNMVKMGQSWIFAITSCPNVNIEGITRYGESILLQGRKLKTDGITVHTSRGLIPYAALTPNLTQNDTSQDILPTETGSRIGVMYVPQAGTDLAEMHFIINGVDQGVCGKDIPYREGPLHAVVDVYGTTKQVRIVQLYGVSTLQSACRDVILQYTKLNAVDSLPLPQLLKDFLLYQNQESQ